MSEEEKIIKYLEQELNAKKTPLSSRSVYYNLRYVSAEFTFYLKTTTTGDDIENFCIGALSNTSKFWAFGPATSNDLSILLSKLKSFLFRRSFYRNFDKFYEDEVDNEIE